MAFDFRNAFVCYALPQYLSGRLVDRVDLPRVLRIVFNWRHVAEQSVTCFVFSTTHRRGHENLVAPNHGTRMRKTGDVDFPADALRSGRVPLHWLSRTLDDAARTWTTKLRPI